MGEDLEKKADPVAKILMIDGRGFLMGLAPDSPEVRDYLEKGGFEICRGDTYTVATKQYAQIKKRKGV